jgi:molybdate transport system substrate-binding protein
MIMHRVKTITEMLIALALICLQGREAVPAETITVFAAASTTDSLTKMGDLFLQRGMGKVIFSFASSSTLAKQIERGAPAQVFLSADSDWMDYLSARNLIKPESRFDLLGNRLVLIAPKASPLVPQSLFGMDLSGILESGRLAVGDPDHVPAGKYAKFALQKLGLWADAEKRLARADSVRAALALVERGEAPLGIVYSTDAAITTKVRVIAAFAEDGHPPIVYPIALVAGSETSPAQKFIDFLRTTEAGKIFEGSGFVVRP